MCGRYHFTRDTAEELLIAVLDSMDRKYPEKYKTGEIFPGDYAPGVINWHGKIVPVPARFGFPGFQENKLLINARSETVAEKKTFADSFWERRIILPATGFYEWSHDARKQKYLFSVEEHSALYLCGIYKVIENVCRFVILTREANASMIETHDRMPVIVSADEVRPYLTDLNAASGIIHGQAPVLSRSPA